MEDVVVLVDAGEDGVMTEEKLLVLHIGVFNSDLSTSSIPTILGKEVADIVDAAFVVSSVTIEIGKGTVGSIEHVVVSDED